MTGWLLLHGTPLTPAVWDEVLPLLAEHGPPAAPPVHVGHATGRTAQATSAADLAACVGDPPPPWHVVGHSFGGQVGLELTACRPDLVSALTLLCTRDTAYPPFEVAADDIAGNRADIDRVLRRWFSPIELSANSSAVRYAHSALCSADRAEWAAALRAISVFDGTAATRSITRPALIVAAEHDEVSDPATSAAMHRRLRGSQFAVLRGARHMSIFTDPHTLAGLCLRRHDEGRSAD